MSLIIRHATPEDVPAICEIYNYAVRETVATFDTVERTLEDRVQWLAAHGGQHPVLVAEEDGVVVGWASLSPYSDRCAYVTTAENSVYVHPAHFRRGIGKRLLQALLGEARALGYHVILARIATENDTSITLHRKFGFTDVGVMHEVGRKFGRWLDVLVMEARL